MGKEIERKFLVKGDSWKNGEGTQYRQGYLNQNKERTVRVRIAGDRGFLTIKGLTVGAVRREYEYEIPCREAEEILEYLCEKPLIEKIRYKIPYRSVIVEVDEFLLENRGLVLAEVELESENQIFEKPDWLGKEVTDDPRYHNSNLVQNPFSCW